MTGGAQNRDPAARPPGEPAGAKGQAVDFTDPHPSTDAPEDTWAWRRRLRADPRSHLAYRCLVAALGSLVTIVGLVMVPAPGPGWVVVFLGLTILASEFEFAQRLLHFARGHVTRWNDWIMAQTLLLRGALALGTLAGVWVLFWAWLAWRGVPSFVPAWAAALVRLAPGIE